MRIRLSDPALIDDLQEFLQGSPDVVLEVVDDNEVEVSLLGSYRLDTMRMEVDLRVRAWEAARNAQGRVIRLIDDPA